MRRELVLRNLYRADGAAWEAELLPPPPRAAAPYTTPCDAARARPWPSSLRVWFTDFHSGFLADLVAVWRLAAAAQGTVLEVQAQSVSLYCEFHGTCATDPRVKALLPTEELTAVAEGAGLLNGFQALERAHEHMPALQEAFARLDLDADVFLCAFPTFWCALHDLSDKPLVTEDRLRTPGWSELLRHS